MPSQICNIRHKIAHAPAPASATALPRPGPDFAVPVAVDAMQVADRPRLRLAIQQRRDGDAAPFLILGDLFVFFIHFLAQHFLYSHRIVMEDAKPVDVRVPTDGFHVWRQKPDHPGVPRAVDLLEAEDIVLCGELLQVILQKLSELLVMLVLFCVLIFLFLYVALSIQQGGSFVTNY